MSTQSPSFNEQEMASDPICHDMARNRFSEDFIRRDRVFFVKRVRQFILSCCNLHVSTFIKAYEGMDHPRIAEDEVAGSFDI